MKNTFFDYFGDLQNKYSSKISRSTPFVLRLDGKECTSSGKYNLTKPNENDFASCFLKAAQSFSKNYKCYIYIALDEINIIMLDPSHIINIVGSSKIQDIVAVLSQQFVRLFNQIFNGDEYVFFSANCFSIPENKIISYLKYRVNICKNVLLVYFSKMNNYSYHKQRNIKYNELNYLLSKETKFLDRNTYEICGLLFFNGIAYDVENYINGDCRRIDLSTFNPTDDKFSENPLPLIGKKMEIDDPEEPLLFYSEIPNKRIIDYSPTTKTSLTSILWVNQKHKTAHLNDQKPQNKSNNSLLKSYTELPLSLNDNTEKKDCPPLDF